jgi:hypothetical protein
MVVGEWSPWNKYCDKNHGKIHSPNFYFLYYMQQHFWSMDVICYVEPMGRLPRTMGFWDAKYNQCNMTNRVKILLDSFGMFDKVIDFVKMNVQI